METLLLEVRHCFSELLTDHGDDALFLVGSYQRFPFDETTIELHLTSDVPTRRTCAIHFLSLYGRPHGSRN